MTEEQQMAEVDVFLNGTDLSRRERKAALMASCAIIESGRGAVAHAANMGLIGKDPARLTRIFETAMALAIKSWQNRSTQD